MSLQLEPSMDVALQHVLGNGLTILRGRQFDAARRNEVLDDLVQIFVEANRGAQALGGRNLLFALAEPPAFERYSLFFRYLKDTFGAQLPERLSEAAAVFTALKDNQQQAENKLERSAELVEALLKALKREGALSPLVAPHTYSYG